MYTSPYRLEMQRRRRAAAKAGLINATLVALVVAMAAVVIANVAGPAAAFLNLIQGA